MGTVRTDEIRRHPCPIVAVVWRGQPAFARARRALTQGATRRNRQTRPRRHLADALSRLVRGNAFLRPGSRLTLARFHTISLKENESPCP
jgi:hypothetical protein